MSNLSDQVWAWYQQGDIKAEQLPKALATAEQAEPEVAWREVIDLLLLWFGVLFVSAGVIIFFAFNWQDLSKMGKFALVQGALLLCALAYGWLRWQERDANPDGLGGTKANAALLGLSFMIGALLALVGQTYQTGADPWQLFAIWSLCLLPLAWLAGFDLLWLKLLALINLTLVLYFNTWPQAWWWFDEFQFSLVAFSLLNLAMYLLLVTAPRLGWARLNSPIAQAFSIVISLIALTLLGCWQMIGKDEGAGASLTFYTIFVVCVFFFARFAFKQLLPIALISFSLIAVTTFWLVFKVFFNVDSMAIPFIIAMYIVFTAALASVWLTKLRNHLLNINGESNDG